MDNIKKTFETKKKTAFENVVKFVDKFKCKGLWI
tara:strand:+ start:626 stop:727 length:102 start_codon:yes stop_codon:yes gene_type:complete